MGIPKLNSRSKKRRRRGEPDANERVISKKKRHFKPKFMTFPPEIRNKIYHEVLVPALDDDNHGHVISLAQPGLTRTSRQIRNETLPIFYGQNRFAITIPPTNSRDWDVPRTDRVTRSLARRRAEYKERELPIPGGDHPDFLTWMHPKGWGQFLYTLDVMITGGPASAGGKEGPFRLMPFLSVLYQHPLSLPSAGWSCSIWHYNVGFTAKAEGVDHSFFRAFWEPSRMLDAQHNVTRFDSLAAAERDLAELLYAVIKRRRHAALWSFGEEPEDWAGDATFQNLLVSMCGMMALCPRLRERCYLRVDRGVRNDRWCPLEIGELTELEPVQES